MWPHEGFQSTLDILAEANDQFHWGRRLQEVEEAAQKLCALKLCPGLICEMEAKIARMRIIDRLHSQILLGPVDKPRATQPWAAVVVPMPQS